MRPDDALREPELRRRLGIPAGAERVILFAESSHWDPGWLKTTEEYYAVDVRRALDEALDELARSRGVLTRSNVCFTCAVTGKTGRTSRSPSARSSTPGGCA